MSVTVKWNNKKYNIKFPLDTVREGYWTDYVTLYDLKKRCNELTNIPIDRMKVLFQGAALKNNKATLTSFGIKNGSVIMLMGKADPKPANNEQTETPGNGDYYPMPKPGNTYPQNYQEPPQSFYPQNQGYYPPPPQGYGYAGYPPPPGYGYGGYPPPPPGYGYGYPPPPQNPYGQSNPAMPNPAYMSSPTQNPSQTIRISNPNGDYTNNPFYQQQPNGANPNPNQNQSSTNTPGTASPAPQQNTSKMSKDELKKQAQEQPIVFLDNCINETRGELEPLVNMYADKVKRHPNGEPMTKDLEQTYLRASELLMQKLLLVDQVMAGQNEEIRTKRKTAVKLIQGLIDKLDDSKTELKQKIGK